VNIEADWIAVGNVNNAVQISSIDYDTNTITLASPITWNDNDSIWLYKKSDGEVVLSGSAPDIGAYEYIQPDVVIPDPACTYTATTWSTCVNGSQSRTLTATHQPCTGDLTKTETQSCTVPDVLLLLTTSATNGTVTKSPNYSTYGYGQVITLTATPNSGYTFTNWTGDISTTTNPLTITMDGDQTLIANFTVRSGGSSPGGSGSSYTPPIVPVTPVTSTSTATTTPGLTTPVTTNSSICNFINLLITIQVIEPSKATMARTAFKCPPLRSDTSSAGQAPTSLVNSGQASLLLTINLYPEMRHPDVIKLKSFLTKHGYLSDTTGTDYYGPLTTEAVQKFQKANNIVTSGTPTTTGYGAVGPKTRGVINQIK